MKRKIWSLILSLTLLFSLSMPVAAKTDQQIDSQMIQMIVEDNDDVFALYDEINTIETVIIDEKLKNQIVDAYYCNEEGVYSELDCDFELKKVSFYDNIQSKTSKSRSSENTMYVLSAETKKSENDTTEDDVYLYGCICWIDNAGVSNQIQYVTGYRSGAYSGTGNYTVTGGTVGLTSGTFSTSFYDDSSDNQAMVFRLRIHSDTTSGGRVSLLVATSMFD